LIKGTLRDKVTLSSEEIKPVALLSYTWLKILVSWLVENSVMQNFITFWKGLGLSEAWLCLTNVAKFEGNLRLFFG